MASLNQEAARDRDEVTPAIAALVAAWATAWNAHDMQAAAALVADDVEFVTVRGRWLRGRGEFLRHHMDIHRGHLRKSCWTTVGHTLRALCDHLVLVHHEWTIAGEMGGQDAPLPTRAGVFTWVVARAGDTWRIAAAHNTNSSAQTSHRSIAGGIS
jgi:uncharacterized protein (TIGR02246 family)